MLREIYLQNYLFVDKARIQFKAGMCVLTGETGAGKSVLVGAITLLFGDNSQSFEAYDDSLPIYLEATFDIQSNLELQAFIAELGHEPEPELIIARQISEKGKSQYFLYGRKVSAAVVKDLKPHLIDFHHQRDQQKLLGSAYQLEILDSYASLQEDVSAYRKQLSAIKQSFKALASLKADEQRNRDLAELYAFQLEELSKADLKRDEDLLLQQEFELLSAADEISRLSVSCSNALFEDENSAYDRLNSSLAQLSKYADLHPDLASICDQIGIALDAINHGAKLLSSLPDSLSYDPLHLQNTQNRLDALNSLKQKHRVASVTELMEMQELLKQKADSFENISSEISELERKIDVDYDTLMQSLDSLGQKRRIAAAKLSMELEENIRMLSIPKAIFEIRIDKIGIAENDRQNYLNSLNERGCDICEMYFCANPGSTTRPLSAVASGGELSRVLLAIKKVLTQSISPKLMILDEIDSGLGGKTAEAIASYIKDISKRHTVLCISHLAQLAVVADQHIALSKSISANRTTVLMTELIGESRQMEIARMLSGNITEYSLKHAEELLNKNI